VNYAAMPMTLLLLLSTHMLG